MVFLECAVSYALFGEAVPPVRAAEVSAAGEAIRGVVREKWLCAGRIPTKGGRARGENSQGARIFDASLGRENPDRRLSANVAVVERRCRKSRGGTNSNLFVKQGELGFAEKLRSRGETNPHAMMTLFWK